MIKIAFDTTALLEQAEVIGRLDTATLAKLRTDAVNAVSLTVREKAIDVVLGDLNLQRDYVETRLEREASKGATAKARVVSEVRGATLQRFGATQQTKPVNWSNSRIRSLGLEFGNWPGWTERKGDPSRGIAANDKASGVAVDVNRKGSKRIATAFTLPLNNNNGTGTFRREGGKLKQLYGPSVYQVFRRYITTNEQEISDNLRDDFMVRLDTKIEEILK